MPPQPPPPPHAPATTILPKPLGSTATSSPETLTKRRSLPRAWMFTIDGLAAALRTLSPDHQRAVVDLLQPFYDQLVLQPQDPFEQLTGNGLVYLLWDELLRQCQIGSMQNVPFSDHTDRSRHMAELLRSPNKPYEPG